MACWRGPVNSSGWDAGMEGLQNRLQAQCHQPRYRVQTRGLTLSPTAAVTAVIKWQPGCDAKYHGLGLTCIGPFHHHHQRPVREALIIPIL